MGTRRMLTAAIAGACCVIVGVLLVTSAARSAATTVPVSVRPGGMLVLNPATVTAHQGDAVKWTRASFGMVGPVKAPLSMTCSSRRRARPASQRW